MSNRPEDEPSPNHGALREGAYEVPAVNASHEVDTPPTPSDELITLVVVGRANTGKSTLVATLTEDDSIRISDVPGTTTAARKWVVHVDRHPILSVIDTPGFEDAVGALGILRTLSKDASDRPDAVRAFVQMAEREGTFQAERRLLTPVLEGGAILYVADASAPYRRNFEAELEILSWTGQPRAGLINCTHAAHLDAESLARQRQQWRNALTQYCSIVRELDARDATWDERIHLLRDIASLRSDWRESMLRVADQIESQWMERRQNAAYALAKMLTEALTHQRRERVVDPENLSHEKRRLEEAFAQDLRRIEEKGQKHVERAYGFTRLSRAEQDAIEAPRMDEDLFSKEAWDALGLSTGELVASGAITGALSGLGVDALLGGTSLGLGALVGAAIGAGGAAYYRRDAIAKATVERTLDTVRGEARFRRDEPTRRIVVGPHQGPNFPWVLLARGLGHWYAVERRTHAQTDALQVHAPSLPASEIPDAVRHTLQRLFKAPDATMIADLETALLSLYKTPAIQAELERAHAKINPAPLFDMGD